MGFGKVGTSTVFIVFVGTQNEGSPSGNPHTLHDLKVQAYRLPAAKTLVAGDSTPGETLNPKP